MRVASNPWRFITVAATFASPPFGTSLWNLTLGSNLGPPIATGTYIKSMIISNSRAERNSPYNKDSTQCIEKGNDYIVLSFKTKKCEEKKTKTPVDLLLKRKLVV